MSRTLSLTNSKDIIANSIKLIIGNDVVDVTELFSLKEDTGSSNDPLNTSIINAPTSLDLKINSIPKIQISSILTTMNQPLNMNDSNVINLNEISSTLEQPLIINTTGTAGQFIINNYGSESFSIFKSVCYINNGLVLNDTIQMNSNILDGVKQILGNENVDVEIDTTGTGNLILKRNAVEKIKITSTSTDLYGIINVPTTLIVSTKNILDELNDRYTKIETNALLILKLDAATINNYYLKTEIDTKINAKLNASVIDSYYTKSVSDVNYYYKAQSDTLLNDK